MTREGVLLSGPELSEAEQAAVIQEDNGFTSRAAIRAQTPTEPYRDLSLEAGAFALESAAGGFRLDGDRGLRVAADGGLSDATTNALRDGALQFNGSVLKRRPSGERGGPKLRGGAGGVAQRTSCTSTTRRSGIGGKPLGFYGF